MQNNCGIPEVKVNPVRLNEERKIVEKLSQDVGPVSEVQEKDNCITREKFKFSQQG